MELQVVGTGGEGTLAGGTGKLVGEQWGVAGVINRRKEGGVVA